MSADFHLISALVSSNIATLVRNMSRSEEAFWVEVTGDELYDFYLSSFPEGTNPVFRKATEHECSCCRAFIKNVGGMVFVQNGILHTIWEGGSSLPTPYREVAQAMDQYIRQFMIQGIYRTQQEKYGTAQTRELIDGLTKTWNHFHVSLASRFVSKDAATAISEAASRYQVFKRGLEELTQESLDTILELIQNKGLYRGEEFKRPVEEFKAFKAAYMAINDPLVRDRFVWSNIGHFAARFRNTAIGTLAVDLSSGEDMEKAAEAFGRKLDPVNYKRPKSIITKKMIDNAQETLRQLGLESTLRRRHATLSDISVNNVLWVDREARNMMKDNGLLHDLLSGSSSVATAKAPDFSKAPILTVDEFLSAMGAYEAIELHMENSLVPNLMSLTAPQEGSTGRLLKWNNDFAWSYNGELADSSIAKKVEKAGGRIVGAQMRISLAWFNKDDLDLHVLMPGQPKVDRSSLFHRPVHSNHVYFGNKQEILDVDMNAFGVISREPVENCSWMTRPADGIYQVAVNNYNKRENQDFGFDLEVESAGRVMKFGYRKPVVGSDGKIGGLSTGLHALNVKVEGGVVVGIQPVLDMEVNGIIGQDIWGMKTETMVKVNTIMFSPNYWDEQTVGNKHIFFMLEGARNPEPIRGFYNEFLSNELTPHRKVFEVLGSKTKIEPTDEQLSGVGVSSTQDKHINLLVTLQGRKRPIRILFG